MPMIEDPVAVLAVLLGVLACLFAAAKQNWGDRLFRVVPLLVFAYFLPTALSNSGIIPLKNELYDFVKHWLLPASLILLTMSVDIPAVLRLGKNQLLLFLGGTATIVIGGPLALAAFGWLIPPEMHEQSWRGLAALSGSWIGGGANFVAIGESVGATDSTMAMMVVVDVAIANIWMAILLFFAGHEKAMDASIGADRRAMETLRAKSEKFQQQVARPTSLADLLLILFIGIGGAVLASTLASHIAPRLEATAPAVADILGEFAWKVLIATAIGVGLSYTRLRSLEGAGSSKVGSTFLYLLVATIGAKAEFSKVLEVPSILLIGAVWIAVHATALLLLRRWLRSPIFCMAVGSQANIGGAASAPVVASAFHPALAPVGALMGVMGYVLGTGAGLLCAFLLRSVSRIWG